MTDPSPTTGRVSIKLKHRQMRYSVRQLCDDFHLDSYFTIGTRCNMRSIPLWYFKNVFLDSFIHVYNMSWSSSYFSLNLLVPLPLMLAAKSFMSFHFVLWPTRFNQGHSVKYGAWATSTEENDFLSSSRSQLLLVMKQSIWDSYW